VNGRLFNYVLGLSTAEDGRQSLLQNLLDLSVDGIVIILEKRP
jgi:hypothetical protein